ncbi:Uncharacterised protein [Mycobacterium tuberculosis]|nr:Uncharacterised protein [Mycobacterium tuberculosis]
MLGRVLNRALFLLELTKNILASQLFVILGTRGVFLDSPHLFPNYRTARNRAHGRASQQEHEDGATRRNDRHQSLRHDRRSGGRMRRRIQSSERREKHLSQTKNTGERKHTAQGAQQKVQHHQTARINVPILDPIQNDPEERHHHDGVRQNLRQGITQERADVHTTTRGNENLVRIQEEIHQDERHSDGIGFTKNCHSSVIFLFLVANYAKVSFRLFKRRPLIICALSGAGANLR